MYIPSDTCLVILLESAIFMGGADDKGRARKDTEKERGESVYLGRETHENMWQ